MNLSKEKFLRDLSWMEGKQCIKTSLCAQIQEWMRLGEMEIFPFKRDSHHELVATRENQVVYRNIRDGKEDELANLSLEKLEFIYGEVKEQIAASF